MDKTAQELLKQAQNLMATQSEEIKDLREKNSELSILKMAYDVAGVMLVKESIDESAFQETVEDLRQRPLEDLQKRAEILQVIDPTKDLVLGDIDERTGSSDKTGSSPSSQTSERQLSAQATDAGRSLIESFVN